MKASKWLLPNGKEKSGPSIAMVLTPGKGLARQLYRLSFLHAVPMIVVLPCEKGAFLESVDVKERDFYSRWLRNAHNVVVAEKDVEDTIRGLSEMLIGGSA